jgi:hypothetical protein
MAQKGVPCGGTAAAKASDSAALRRHSIVRLIIEEVRRSEGQRSDSVKVSTTGEPYGEHSGEDYGEYYS